MQLAFTKIDLFHKLLNIMLSLAEPGPVQFEEIAIRPTSGGSRSENRVGSAGRVERKLQMARKKVLNQDEAGENSAGAGLSIDSGSSATGNKLLRV